MPTFTTIGQPRPLHDGQAKVTGTTHYAPDLTLPGMLHARFVTSLYAHAKINKIDVEAALAVPGVVTILTASDLPEIIPDSRARLLLARKRVIFVGQPVALVLADTESAAQDGVEQVVVDYEPLPAAITMDEALAPDAPLVWPEGVPGEAEEAAAHGADLDEQQTAQTTLSNVADTVEFSRGDVEVGFAEADVIVERTFTTPIVHQSYLEPHATLVQPDPLTGGATLWTSTQAPFYVRQQVAKILEIPEADVRVTATPAGGAFGGKFILFEPLVALAAKITGRPVRLVLSRLEEMLAGNPSQAIRLEVRLGAKADGTFTALAGQLTIDGGCYPSSLTGLAAILLGSLYRIPHLSIKGREVLTFKTSTTAYRAPGAPQAAFALETLIDEIAHSLQRDPLGLRIQNAVEIGDPLVTGQEWPEIGMKLVLETLKNQPAWQDRAKTQAAGRGVGIAIGGWPGGVEPAAATCTVDRDGILQVHVGAVDLTGTITGFALIAAETLGLPPEKVRVIAGDTAVSPYAGGAGGSKITYTVGPAIIQAVEEARLQLFAIAAEEMEADPADMEIMDGKVQVRGVPERAIPLGEIAAKTMQFGGQYAPILGHGRNAETTRAPAFCAQLAEVVVDQETGQVSVERLVVVQDVGRAINPLTIDGQIMGGVAQGLGWALYENMIHDESGQLLTASWMDYTIPHIDQVAPVIETVHLENPSPLGPFGARGVGEPPIIATAAAVANAIADATGRRLTDLPLTAPRVLAALQSANGQA